MVSSCGLELLSTLLRSLCQAHVAKVLVFLQDLSTETSFQLLESLSVERTDEAVISFSAAFVITWAEGWQKQMYASQITEKGYEMDYFSVSIGR